MKLGTKQEIFSRSLAKLLLKADAKDYGIRLRELQRTKEQAQIYYEQGKGILNSNHRNCLAIDLYITVHGVLRWDGLPYEVLADFWKGLSVPGAEHCWGGDFRKYRDVYHYSIKHNGVV